MLFVCFVFAAFAGPKVRHAPLPDQAVAPTTASWESSYGPMIDRSAQNLYRCYIGLQVPMSDSGWFEATIVNDTLAPVGIRIAGIEITFWKPQMALTQGEGVVTRPLPDRVIVNDGGADQESAVLNPGEVCSMTLPFTRLEGRKARWHVVLTQYAPVNPYWQYVPVGLEGRVSSAQHQTLVSVQDEWVLFYTGDRRIDRFRLSSKLGGR